MTHEEAKKLKKGKPIIFSGQNGSEQAQEVKWVGVDYHKNGDVIGICVDNMDRHRWGYLYQYTLFPKYEF